MARRAASPVSTGHWLRERNGTPHAQRLFGNRHCCRRVYLSDRQARPHAPWRRRQRRDLPPLGGCVWVTLGKCRGHAVGRLHRTYGLPDPRLHPDSYPGNYIPAVRVAGRIHSQHAAERAEAPSAVTSAGAQGACRRGFHAQTFSSWSMTQIAHSVRWTHLLLYWGSNDGICAPGLKLILLLNKKGLKL